MRELDILLLLPGFYPFYIVSCLLLFANVICIASIFRVVRILVDEPIIKARGEAGNMRCIYVQYSIISAGQQGSPPSQHATVDLADIRSTVYYTTQDPAVKKTHAMRDKCAEIRASRQGERVPNRSSGFQVPGNESWLGDISALAPNSPRVAYCRVGRLGLWVCIRSVYLGRSSKSA
ncbi:hypothetical protein F4823DRAFT_339351 [Ustulina deusta]|nr:hypothetical protein F4823DRAFT_339351 [Ustulina deusta]